MTKKITPVLFLTIGAFFYQTNAQVINLGTEVHPDDVSNTGTVTGSYENSFFIWTLENGLKNIGDIANGSPLSGSANISSDGSKIALTITNTATNVNEMALYDVTTQNHTYLGGIGATSGGYTSNAYNISSDGKTIVGLGWFIDDLVAHPVKWSDEAGITDMGSTQTGKSARANAVNADGSVIGGWQDTDMGRTFAIWKNGVQTLVTEDTEYGTLPLNEASAVSDNGIWATGSSILGYAVIWSEATGVIKINHPDASLETGFSGAATAVNSDGTAVVGYFRNLFVNPAPDSGEGFIWTPETGRVELTAYAQSLGIDTQGVTFNLPLGISPNGKYIVGWGKQNGNPIGFRLELPENTSGNCSQGSVDITLEEGNPITDSTQKIADDFVVEAGKKMTISQIKIKTVHLGGNLGTIAFNFYKDNAGLPGDVAATVSAMTPTSMTQVGTYYGFPVYEVVADLPTPVVLNEGTYWLNPVGTGSNVYWGTTSTNTGGNKTALQVYSAPWTYTSLSTAYSIFEVSGTCEDATSLGISDIKSSGLSYYPNPVKDVLNIISDKKIKNVSVYNTAGQLLLTTDKVISGQVNVSALRSGVYLFTATTADGEIKTFKIIKN